MAAKYKFKLTEHLLRMIGICADCRRQVEKITHTKELSANAAKNTRR